MSAARSCAALLLAGLLACSSEADSGSIEAELGQGEIEFAPLAEDDTLPYAAGSQGGHHVFISFRARGIDPERVLVSVETTIEDRPKLTLRREGRVNFEPSGKDTHDYAGWPAQILLAPCHEGERAHIAATLTDREDRSVDLERWIRIGEGPEPSAMLCD
ncbi:MAG TPA: hypothetical protein VJV78_16125 [Polyangiales bacterium]|nr:hypothetical protein [Polyangiales bacterium]